MLSTFISTQTLCFHNGHVYEKRKNAFHDFGIYNVLKEGYDMFLDAVKTLVLAFLRKTVFLRPLTVFTL